MGKKRRSTWKEMLLLVVILVLGSALSGCLPSGAPAAGEDDVRRIAERYPALRPESAERGTVSKVVDGDTFELAGGEKVRLIGVDTPETHGRTEPYGKEASAFTKQELLGHDVVMFADTSDRDRYGRLLRYVFVEGGDVMFNERLLVEGYAQVMTVAPNVTFAEAFLELQRKARSANAGLWGAAPGNDGKEKADPETSSAEAPPSCPNPIKGNINAKGDQIYHIPGGASYKSTKPERWFCSEQEARDAGFRKAAR